MGHGAACPHALSSPALPQLHTKVPGRLLTTHLSLSAPSPPAQNELCIALAQSPGKLSKGERGLRAALPHAGSVPESSCIAGRLRLAREAELPKHILAAASWLGQFLFTAGRGGSQEAKPRASGYKGRLVATGRASLLEKPHMAENSQHSGEAPGPLRGNLLQQHSSTAPSSNPSGCHEEKG